MEVNQVKSEEVGILYDQEIGKFWESIQQGNMHVAYYENDQDETPKHLAAEKLTRMVIAETFVDHKSSLIDIGCGVGMPAIMLAKEKGCRVDGITVSRSQLDQAKENAAREGAESQVQFSLADAMNLPFKDESYDFAWFFESIFHMPDRYRVLSEAKRVLKKNGTVLITDILIHTPLSLDDRDFIFNTFHVASLAHTEEYDQIMKKAGYQIRKVIDITQNTRRSQWVNVEFLNANRSRFIKQFGSEKFGKLEAVWPRFAKIYDDHFAYWIIIADKV